VKHPVGWIVWAVAGVGAALLVIDHWAHVFGVLPYILLACPLMHLFMHRGHGHGSARQSPQADEHGQHTRRPRSAPTPGCGIRNTSASC
jgi:hypothetical protein